MQLETTISPRDRKRIAASGISDADAARYTLRALRTLACYKDVHRSHAKSRWNKATLCRHLRVPLRVSGLDRPTGRRCPGLTQPAVLNGQMVCAPVPGFAHFDLCSDQRDCKACAKYCDECGRCTACHAPPADPARPSLKHYAAAAQTEIRRRQTCGSCKAGPRTKGVPGWPVMDFTGVPSL